VLVACASVLQVAESLFPHPVPGVRLGLANIVTLVALVRSGARTALAVAALRTLVAALATGTFLGPTFVLSFGGGVTSALGMALAYRLLPLSCIGISVAGSVGHVGAQVALVYLLFVRSPGVLWLWPWLVLSAVLTGVLTGLVAMQALRRLETAALPAAPGRPAAEDRTANPCPGGSAIHRLDPAVKIVAVFVLGMAVILFDRPLLYLAVFAALAAAALAARLPAGRLLSDLARLLPLLAASLLLPVLFTTWGRILVSVGPLRVTEDGLRSGGVFAARIGLLFFATAILALTTPPAGIADGLGRLLRPLGHVGLDPGRVARTLALAWAWLPVFRQRVRGALRVDRGRRGWLDRTLHLPGDVLADLYLLAESEWRSTRESA